MVFVEIATSVAPLDGVDDVRETETSLLLEPPPSEPHAARANGAIKSMSPFMSFIVCRILRLGCAKVVKREEEED